MCRLIELIVRSGLVTAWRFANCPTSRSPVFVNATTDGVVRLPSAFGMTVGVEPSITAITELVVPRSMPTIFDAMRFPLRCCDELPRLERQLAAVLVVAGDHVGAVAELA